VALVHHHGVAFRYAALRGGLVRGIEWNHHRDYSGRRAVARQRVVMEGQGGAIAREFMVKGGSDRRDDPQVCRNFWKDAASEPPRASLSKLASAYAPR
jgi:hypothetical protein